MESTIAYEEMRQLAMRVFMRHGVPADEANITSEVLVEANARGHDSHGVIRIPKWIEGISSGAIKSRFLPRALNDCSSAIWLDGGQCLGPVVAEYACHLAVRQARDYGIAMVSVRNASHIGMLGFYAELMAKSGCIGTIATNTESGVAPHGSAEKVFGTNPLAIGCPTLSGPVFLDMSTSVVARGKVVLAQRAGAAIPEGWAVDSRGQPTTDPNQALAGALLPVGGPKGSGLSFFVDILCGALSGTAVGKDVRGTFDMRQSGSKGDIFIAIDPEKIGGIDRFTGLAQHLVDQVRQSTPAVGCDRVLVPGEYEMNFRKQRMENGIPLASDLISELKALSGE